MLNGAPLCKHLDFNESSLLGAEDCNAFDVTVLHSVSPNNTATALKWRRLTRKDTRLPSGWSQPYLPGASPGRDQAGVSFSIPGADQSFAFPENDTTDLDTTITVADQSSEVVDFLRHSFIFHDSLLSSQVSQDPRADNVISSSSVLTTSFCSTTPGSNSQSGVDGYTLIRVPSTIITTPLASLYSAHQLRSIYPRRPTLNLLCVMITRPERREVFVRKNGGYKMDLWEITVADDTQSGFRVSFWARPLQEANKKQAHTHNPLLHTLESLNVGDILLLRNIALTSFRDTVHGQSLNPAITRARTTIDVLMRGSGVSIGQVKGLPATLTETFMRVKRWARAHVAADNIDSRKRKGSSPKEETRIKRPYASPEYDASLPPDTLEAL